MKTTENISIAGYAFTVEKDAYEELIRYLEALKSIFEGREGAEDIVADIEERVAELLAEKYRPGMTINLAMIDDIKKRIGNPEELAQEDGSSEQQDVTGTGNPKKEASKNKRIYRNIDDRVIGGVCSGLGIYFRLDKVFFRLAFTILFAIGVFAESEGFLGIATIGYLCLWIAMPAARTAEQKREMRGRPTDLESYRNAGFELKKEMNEVAESPAGRTFKRAGGVFLGILLLFFGCGLLLCSLLIPSMNSIIEAMLGPAKENMEAAETFVRELITFSTFWRLFMVWVCIAALWLLYNGVMLTFGLKSPSWRPGLVLFIAWLVSWICLIGWPIWFFGETFTKIFV